jgi:TRAP-type C4-dicarboxylate transport system permease small subunit
MRQYIKKLGDSLAVVSGLLMSLLMALLVIDVVMRNLGYPLHGVAELSVFVMMIVIYLGFAHCESENTHVRLEFLTDKLPAKGKRRLNRVVWALSLGTVGLLTYAVVGDALTSFRRNDSIEGIINLPIWPTKFVMSVGMFAFLLQVIVSGNRSD